MATSSIVSLITQYVTPETLARIASATGIDRAALQKAVGAGVPGILAALVASLSKPGAAARIENAVAQQEPGLLDNLTRIIGSPQQSSFAAEGLGSLSSLLGGAATSALTTALNKYAGTGESGAQGLLGLLGPLVLGVLGRQAGDGRGGASVAQLLQSQKDNIARALPPGFASVLKGTGILDDLPQMATAQAPLSRQTGTEASRNWLLPVLAALAVLGVGWYLLSRGGPETTPTHTQAQMGGPGETFVVAEQDVGKWLQKPVYSSDNQKIGEIIELTRGPDNRVTDVYLDAGQFLGMGGERYRVTADQIREVKPDGLVLTLTEADVKAQANAASGAAAPPPATTP